jgi:hypothetical protein
VDALLQALAHARQAYPSLHTEVDEVVLAWNYCDVFFGGEAWDLAWVEGRMVRTRARAPSRGFAGFKSWGFLAVDPVDRVVPRLLLENPLGRGQREWFIGAAVLQQCFPHPITGRTTFEDAEPGWTPPGVRSSPLPNPTTQAEPEEEWTGNCPARIAASLSKTLPAPAAPPPLSGSPPSPAPSPGQARGARPFVLIAPSTQGGIVGPLQPVLPVERGLGLSGNLRTTARLAGGAPSVGTSAGWAPADNTFIRVGLDQNLSTSPAALPTYSWGFGYNDSHPGTFSAEVNNWAVPINKFNGESIALAIGYKIALPEIVQKYLGAGVDITVPFASPPTLGVGLSGRPYGNFFLMSALRFSPFVTPAAVTWSYGFGYSDWNPYTVAIQYNNWGPNPVFVPNFVKNGSVTISWSWAM